MIKGRSRAQSCLREALAQRQTQALPQSTSHLLAGRAPGSSERQGSQPSPLCEGLSVTVVFPGGSEIKVSAWNAGDPDSVPGLGRLPGEGHGNPLQYSYLENHMDGGAWWAIVLGVTQSQVQLSS